MINSIIQKHKSLKKIYDSGDSPIDQLKEISLECLEKVASELEVIPYSRIDDKSYIVYSNSTNKSRPVNEALYIRSSTEFDELWDEFLDSIDASSNSSSLSSVQINNLIYTSILSFSICFDVWKPKSRKTPGTHFEVLLGCIIKQFLPHHSREKFVTLPGQEEKVSTDIVFDLNGSGVVIPAKITTRERIVQPYAHQRILDSVFGEGRYKSILLCVSETQRDDDNLLVNDICVPGTLKLFQAHLSQLSGLYYLDPPTRYLAEDITSLISVGNYGDLLKGKLHSMLL